jgi:hypothetical protein
VAMKKSLRMFPCAQLPQRVASAARLVSYEIHGVTRLRIADVGLGGWPGRVTARAGRALVLPRGRSCLTVSRLRRNRDQGERLGVGSFPASTRT